VVLWGAADPWEPVERAREVFEGFVTDFVELPGENLAALAVPMFHTQWVACGGSKREHKVERSRSGWSS
jgi:hypothetical protein